MKPVPHARPPADQAGPTADRTDAAKERAVVPPSGSNATHLAGEGTTAGERVPADAKHAARIQAMFGSIASRYDLLNRALSLGVDVTWRREAVREATRGAPHDVLDVATGTADLAIGLKRAAPGARVTGVDFSEPMLAIGRAKAARSGVDVVLERGDGMALAYPHGCFDVVTIAYGLRNFSDIDAGLREFHRVLRPGGRLVVLEFPPPRRGPIGRLFRTYFLHVLPRIGGVLSRDAEAYSYLPQSVLAFPNPQDLARRMQDAGFRAVRFKLQTFGISALHVALKPVASKPEASNPAASKPEASKPVASSPEASKPVAPRPVATKREATRPVAIDAVTARPADPAGAAVIEPSQEPSRAP